MATKTTTIPPWLAKPRPAVQFGAGEGRAWSAQNEEMSVKTFNVQTNSAGVANGTTVETDLMSLTLPNNLLDQDNEYLEIFAYGVCAANANTKNIKLYFGGTLIMASGAAAANNTPWIVRAMIMRTAAGAQMNVCEMTHNGAIVAPVVLAGTIDETTGCIVKITGTSNTASSDILQYAMIVKIGNAYTSNPPA